MSKSTRKFVAGLLSIAMVLTLVVGLSATASAQTATYTRNLTVGSTGADVTALQTYLASKGFFSVTPTGYFGSITKRALAQFQASVGISPAAGYFGPITRAYLAANGGAVVTTPGTSVPGCPAGAVYNYMTGALCSTTTPSTSTTEGTLTVTQSATPANNANIQTSTDVPVYGVDLKAQLAPVTVSRIDLDVSVYNSGYENPGNFINTIKVWDGSTLVKSWAVGPADFITGTTSTDYYVRLSGINFTVTPGTTKNLVVSFSTNAGIDNSRVVTVVGYGSNSLLAISGNNINSYYNISTITRTHTFVKPGVATLTIAADASNPLSQTYRVNSTGNGAQNASLMAFAAKSESGDSRITSVSGTVSASTTSGPTALYLYDGSTLLGSVSTSAFTAGASQSFTFNNLSLTVPKDVTKVLTITGDFGASTAVGTAASTTVSSVTYQKPNGTSATVSSTVQGNAHYFFTASANWTLISAGTPTAVTTGSGSNALLNSWSNTFSLKAKPVGGSMVLPDETDFAATVSTSSGAVAATVSDVSVVGSPTVLSEGTEYTVNVTVTAATTSVKSGTQTIRFNLTRASSTVGSTQIVQTWGLNNFQSAPLTVAGGTL
jgi:hypothetical protein